MDTRDARAGRDKILRRLAKLLGPQGYARVKPTFYARAVGSMIEFVHLHKFTFGPLFRVHTGIRFVGDPFEAVALNGLMSDTVEWQGAHRYDLGYSTSEDSWDRCAQNIARFVAVEGEPWFLRWRDLKRLATAPDSPLSPDARVAFIASQAGPIDPAHLQRTQELLRLP